MDKTTENFELVELEALKAFFAGMHEDRIRKKYVDAWPVVARFRALDSAGQAEVMRVVNAVKL